MTTLDIMGWAINAGALIGWLVNIKWRKYAMIIFTCVTVPSIFYFALTNQVPFMLRSIFYLFVDIATLVHIFRNERKDK
jgi:hypothetical protein